MKESLAVRPASEAEPQGDLPPRDDTELLETTIVEPFEPEAGPVQLPTSDQALPTSADTQSPVDASADRAADVGANVSAFGHTFPSSVVQLGDPECFFPLPEVDI